MAAKKRAPDGPSKAAGRRKLRASPSVDEDLLAESEEMATTDAEASDQPEILPSRKGLLRSAMVVLLVLTHICAFMVGYYLMPPRVPQVLSPQFSEVHEPSRATRRLGRQKESFDLAAQARALLSFMVEQAGSKIYELHFTTHLKRCRLRANLQQQVLSRRELMPDGSGREERWEGQVLERLQSAAAGKGLDLEGAGKKTVEALDYLNNLQRTAP